jgi:carbon monoxide dehydrogenase subunit G
VPPDRFTHTVHVAAPPERAWAILQEPETWGEIAGVQRIYDASHHPDGTLRSYRFLAEAGMKPYEGSARTIEADQPSLMVVTVDTAEIEGTITTELQPSNPHGTDMTVSLKIRARGILSTMFLPIVSKAIGSGFSRQIDDIARRIEAPPD